MKKKSRLLGEKNLKISTLIKKSKKELIGIILQQERRISELEKRVKEQQKLIKKMMNELEDLTKSNSRGGGVNA